MNQNANGAVNQYQLHLKISNRTPTKRSGTKDRANVVHVSLHLKLGFSQCWLGLTLNKEVKMTKYYTMEEALQECCDEDFLVHEECYRVYRTIKVKKKDIYDFPMTWHEYNSNKWQIKRAEPRVLSAVESLEYYKNKPGPAGYFDQEMIEMFNKGDKNGQLREWLRPEQVELREAVEDLFKGGSTTRVTDAIKNLKPPK